MWRQGLIPCVCAAVLLLQSQASGSRVQFTRNSVNPLVVAQKVGGSNPEHVQAIIAAGHFAALARERRPAARAPMLIRLVCQARACKRRSTKGNRPRRRASSPCKRSCVRS